MHIEFGLRNIFKYFLITILIIQFSLIIFVNCDIITGNSEYLTKEFFIFMNEFFVILLLFYIFFSKKIYLCKLSKKISFGLLAWFLIGIGTSNFWEEAYTFANEKDACTYYSFCDSKNVYYKNDDYFIFLSDSNKISVLKNIKGKYKFISRDLKYTEKNENENIKKYIYEIDEDLYFISSTSETQIDELDKLYLYESEWEVTNIYGTISDSKLYFDKQEA